MPKTQNIKPCSEGNNQKIRRGRPKNPDILQQLAQDIGYEPVDIDSDQVAMTQLKAILHDWINSKDFRKQRALVELVYGKVPANPERKKKKQSVIVEWPDVDNLRRKAEQDQLNDHLHELADTVDDDDSDL